MPNVVASIRAMTRRGIFQLFAAQSDAGVRPMGADAPDEAADMAPDFRAGRRPGGAKDEGDRPSTPGLIDMDRRVTALAVKPVPERELLQAMCSIERVVDIQRHGRGRRVVAGTVDIHHLAPHTDQRAQVRRSPGFRGATGATVLAHSPNATSSAGWPTRSFLPEPCRAPS